MTFHLIELIIFTAVLVGFSQEKTENLIEAYESDINATHLLIKNDKQIITKWSQEFPLKQVNITTTYRLQMIKHTESNFDYTRNNAKWTECLNLTKHVRNKSLQEYYSTEADCLLNANTRVEEKIRGVEQIGREIKKWVRGYKYLVRLCGNEHPNDNEEAGECLVEYMQKDNYIEVLHRLHILRLEADGEFYESIMNSTINLEECQQSNLSIYLTKVRSIVNTINKCYNGFRQT